MTPDNHLEAVAGIVPVAEADIVQVVAAVEDIARVEVAAAVAAPAASLADLKPAHRAEAAELQVAEWAEVVGTDWGEEPLALVPNYRAIRTLARGSDLKVDLDS